MNAGIRPNVYRGDRKSDGVNYNDNGGKENPYVAINDYDSLKKSAIELVGEIKRKESETSTKKNQDTKPNSRNS